ncbi:MAG TPA: cupin domain-containing protein [Candidatus Saccharimonadales bacterium]|nr:cupin domain-containing protein [Candidatus Saccharimonadales bacterium]
MPEPENTTHEFATVTDIEPLALLPGLRVRPVSGERITLAVFELDPGIGMPEHVHPNEQVGLVVRGEFTFTIGGETRLRNTGDMWAIPSGVPHTVERAGAAGCTVVECFSPPRDDWADKPRTQPSADQWPPR